MASSALSFHKFRTLVWDVNHASGLENVAESKPTGWGHPDVVAGVGGCSGSQPGLSDLGVGAGPSGY